MLIEIFDVRVAAQEREQFINDRFEMKLFRGQQRKSVSQRKSGLRAKNSVSAGAGAIGFELPLAEDQLQQILILLHRLRKLLQKAAKIAKNNSAPLSQAREACAHVAFLGRPKIPVALGQCLNQIVPRKVRAGASLVERLIQGFALL